MQNYKKLMELLEDYKKIKVWENITSDDIIKITNHKNPIYVSILGNNKQCLEINLYMGKEELYQQYDVIYGEYAEYPDIHLRLSCYKMVLKDTKYFLEKEEKDLLKNNHIKDDKCAIRIEKGKGVRLISDEEAKKLIPIMEDIVKISQYIKKEKPEFPEETRIDEQYEFKIVDDKLTHKKVKFPITRTIKTENIELDQETLNKVLIFSQSGTFAVGSFYGPFYIKADKEYNRLLILTNLETGEILDMQVFKGDDERNLANYLLKSFLKIKKYPKNLSFVSTDDLLRCKDVISELEINYKVDTNMQILFEQWRLLSNSIKM